MAEPHDLLQLLATRGDARRPICGWRDGLPISYDDFVARVRAWQALLERCRGDRFALYLNDSLEFGAALLGAWQAGKTVYLPGDNLPATCTNLRVTVDGFLGQFPDDCAALIPSIDDATAPHAGFKPLAPEFAGLVVYTSGSTGAAQSIPKKMSQLASEVATLERLFGAMVKARAGADAAAPEVVATVSHQHIYGLLFKVLWPLVAGRPIHARSCAFPEELVPLLAARGCILISSPAHLKRLPASPAWAQVGQRLRAVFFLRRAIATGCRASRSATAGAGADRSLWQLGNRRDRLAAAERIGSRRWLDPDARRRLAHCRRSGRRRAGSSFAASG
ncbi:hypothetical protein ACFS07_14335 [Undibacterium arcticum]